MTMLHRTTNPAMPGSSSTTRCGLSHTRGFLCYRSLLVAQGSSIFVLAHILQVYDISKFASFHPGGAKLLADKAGQDVTTEFHSLHSKLVLTKYARLVIGSVPQGRGQKRSQEEVYGDGVPFGDPLWYHSSFKSPYYNASHIAFRNKCRIFVETNMMPFAADWDKKGGFVSALDLQPSLAS